MSAWARTDMAQARHSLQQRAAAWMPSCEGDKTRAKLTAGQVRLGGQVNA